MKTTLNVLIGLVLASACLAASATYAQTAAQGIDKPIVHPKWTGVWQGNLDGIPAVTLTLADDAGGADGTIVFHLIMKDNGHAFSASTEAHTLIQPRITGDKITFQVKRGNGSTEILNMSAELKSDGNITSPAQIAVQKAPKQS